MISGGRCGYLAVTAERVNSLRVIMLWATTAAPFLSLRLNEIGYPAVFVPTDSQVLINRIIIRYNVPTIGKIHSLFLLLTTALKYLRLLADNCDTALSHKFLLLRHRSRKTMPSLKKARQDCCCNQSLASSISGQPVEKSRLHITNFEVEVT